MSTATKVQCGILFIASALALSAEVCSVLVLIDSGKWTWSPAHLSIASIVAWCTAQSLYSAYHILTNLARVTLRAHFLALTTFIVTGYATAAAGSITAPDSNLYGNLLAWLSANFLLSALVFQLVLVKENYDSLASEGGRTVASVGLKTVLGGKKSLATASATQAAFLALAGIEAILSTVYSGENIHRLPDRDMSYPLARDCLLVTMWWGACTAVYTTVNIVSHINRRAAWLRTIKTDIFLQVICIEHGLEKALVLRHVESPVQHIFTWVCLAALTSSLCFTITYVLLYSESLRSAWTTVMGDGTLADMGGTTELPAPSPIAHGAAFSIAHGVLLSLVGLFTIAGAVQSYDSLGDFEHSWVCTALLFWNALVVLYLDINLITRWTDTLAPLRTVKSELAILAFLFDGGLVCSIAAAIHFEHNGSYRTLIAATWCATATLLLTVVFEIACVKQYGPLKKVGHHSLSSLARWKETLAVGVESEEETPLAQDTRSIDS